MNDEDFGGDTALTDITEDLEIDTLGDAEEVIADDDDTLTGEQPGEDEGDADAEGDELDANEETDDDPDFKDGDEALVSMDDGEDIQLGELKKGYLRGKDYTHKTEAVAVEREEVETMRTNVTQSRQFLQNAYQSLEKFLIELVPPEPDLSLAQKDPGAYQLQKALRENAIAEIEGVLTAKEEVTADERKAADDQRKAYKAEEDRKLVEAMPALKDPARRKAFDDNNHKTAVEFGFTEEEIGATDDNRILRLVHYARLGKIAETNRRNAGRRRSEKPNKGTGRTVPAGRTSGSREAVKRLAKTGSIDDAVGIDFD